MDITHIFIYIIALDPSYFALFVRILMETQVHSVCDK